jgi:excisionase family DNA binding protein
MTEKNGNTGAHADLITPEEAGRRMGFSRSHVYALATRKEIPSIKFGNAVRFDPRDVEAYIEAHRRGTTTGDAA